jgi:hypothetical protein
LINFKSTSPKYNPKIPLKSDRPTCEHPACNKARVISNTYKDGSPAYSRWCRTHFNKRYYDGKSAVRITAEKIGLRPSAYVERAAIIRGFSSLSAYARFLKENPVPAQATVNTPSTKLQQIRSRLKA